MNLHTEFCRLLNDPDSKFPLELRLNLFNKRAVSNEDSLYPGRVPLECLCHGVPIEGPHHLLDFLDQCALFMLS